MKIWFDLSNSPHINLFHDLIRDLEAEGHEIVITSRPLANTVDLLDQRGLKHTIIGEHYGKNIFKKLFGYPIRVMQLRRHLKKLKVDLAVSQSSFHSPIVAKLLGVPSIYTNDNEHALGNIPSFLFATKILIPENLSTEKVRKQGASKKKLLQYPGVKEGIYLWPIAESLRILRSNNSPSKTKIYVRPEPLTAQYYKAGVNFLDDALAELQDDYSITVLPRDRTQQDHYKQSRFSKIIVADKPLKFIDIATDCSLFLGAGGSMTRELAILGVPTISVYQDELLDVDKFLIDKGYMRYEPQVNSNIIRGYLASTFNNPKTNDLMLKGESAYALLKSEILSFETERIDHSARLALR